VIHCVDAHAEGEPSRIIVGGVLDVPGTTMLEKMQHLEREGDDLRRLLLFEPRGSAPLSLDLVLPSSHPEADAGFLIMESCSYEGMSGSNTINTATVLLETGMLPMTEPVTSLVLEAPAGLVRVRADCRDGRCERITFENVPSFATHLDAPVDVPGIGELRVDVAYGGAFCAFVDAEALGYAIVPEEARELADLGERIRPAVAEQLAIAHPVEPALGVLSFVVFTAAPRDGGDARNATVVAPGRLDRCATGTATSARLAVLAARGLIASDSGDEASGRGRGEAFVNESVIGTRLVGRIAGRTTVGAIQAIVPAISGRAWITGTHQFVLDPDDPFPAGFRLPDTWGAGL
jgi:proline racemase